MPFPRLAWQASAALIAALIAVILWRDYQSLLMLLRVQVLGADYSCFWAGAKAALSEPARLYDFKYVTDLQGWPLGPRDIRPFIYPPTALFAFIPFSFGPYWLGFVAWLAATGSLYMWASLKAGAPWWVAMFPCVLLVLDCGQAPFIMGGLTIGAFAIMDKRPTLAGVLLGMAACIKPQIVVLVPIALVAENRWRTLVAAGVTGLVLSTAATLVWGVHIWFDWLDAVARFKDYVSNNTGLIRTGSTPYAWLKHAGFNGAWAYLLAPAALASVWFVFRTRQELPDKLIALFGATLMITPYAMNYEYTLLAPAVAMYLARIRDPRWPLYGLAAAGFLGFIWTPPALYYALALPFLKRVSVPAVLQSPAFGVFKSQA